MVFSCRR